MMNKNSLLAGCLIFPLLVLSDGSAQSTSTGQQASAEQAPSLAEQVRSLRDEVASLSAQVAALQQKQALPETAKTHTSPATTANIETASLTRTPAPASPAETPAPVVSPALAPTDRATLDAFAGTTLNVTLDGYYAYNFNEPYTHSNQLRAYDLSSNSFAINQASVVIEHAPDASAGSPFGGRLDLQFGQATETLQGSSANEVRPQVWRNVFQAYGTYIAPIGSGLQLDFGKFASALGIEGNYTKDQINYSRSFYFNYLPFYHNGLRANYNVSPRVNVAYWLVNGAQQTDDFNGFKSQAFLFTLKPAKTLTWNVNYYFGQESRDTTAIGAPILPTPNGREHIFDTYASWNATPRLTVAAEADLVINRSYGHSAPQHVTGGAAYLRYQLPNNYALAARGEYLADPQGLFSGTGQALKEATATFDRLMGNGLLLRTEYRRDFSNQHYFLTSQPVRFNHAQPTATIGLVWWWGGKQGNW